MSESEHTDELPNDAEATREQAIAQLKKRRDFQSHFFVYLVVNVMFWILWATTSADGYPWPAWISGLWGIALLLNGWDVYLRAPITGADVDRELERLRSR